MGNVFSSRPTRNLVTTVKMKVLKMFLMLLVISGSVDYVKPLNAILKSWSSCGGKKYPNFLHIFNFKHLGDYVHRVDVNLTGEVEFGANLKVIIVKLEKN